MSSIKAIFAGADYSAASKQPNPTWLAVGAFAGGNLQINRLENLGSDKLFATLAGLRASCASLTCGLDFPFSWPLPFLQFVAEEKKLAINECTTYLAGQPFAVVDELARDFALRRVGLSEPRRYTDALMWPKGQSPLHRINPGMLKMTWQGTGLLGDLRAAGFEVLTGENIFATDDGVHSKPARVFEVYPAATLAAFGLPFKKYKGRDPAAREIRAKIIQDLGNSPKLRTVNNVPALPSKDFGGLHFGPGLADLALKSDDALDAVLACLGAVLCFLTPQLIMPGNVLPEPLTTDLKAQIELEGWIFSPYLARPEQ